MRLLVCGSRLWGVEDPELEPLDPYNIAARRDRWLLHSILDGVWAEATMGYMTVDMDTFTLIEGGAKGADAEAAWWATCSPMHSYGKVSPPAKDCPDGLPNYPDEPPFEHLTFKANWGTYGKAAGAIRNQQMIDEGQPEMILAFSHDIANSKGTKDMVNRARKNNIPNYVIG